MQSTEYRRVIKIMVKKAVGKKFPGLKPMHVKELATEIAVAIHARFYGADVDGVANPLWREDLRYQDIFKDRQCKKTAQELLNVDD